MASSTKLAVLYGPLFWISSIQYFITQLAVAAAWPVPYRHSYHTISDLGNTECADYAMRFVCSPMFLAMNISFVLLGLGQAIGAYLIQKHAGQYKLMRTAFLFMIIAGIGTVFVGLFPENESMLLHGLGASLPLVLGNIALILFGTAAFLPKLLRIYSVAAGVIALIALLCFVLLIDFGIGLGTMERIAAYPQTIWLVATGAYLLARNRV